jgi:hypothetical protein
VKIVNAAPPMFEEIVKVFPGAASPSVVFCWGDTMYTPGGIAIPREIKAHERVHSRQQGTAPAHWWARYLVDKEFRLEQELPAHRMQFTSFCEHVKDRNRRSLYLHNVVARALSSPLYGGLITHAEAVRRLTS